MATTYNLFVDFVGVNTMTAEGGTALEAIGKTAIEGGAAPATSPFLKATTAGQKATGKVKVSEALDNALKAGGLVVGLTVHYNGENRAAIGKNVLFGLIEPVGDAISAEPEMPKTVQTWATVALAKAKAEELKTKEAIELLVWIVEKKTAKELWSFELYISVEVEEATAKKVSAATSSGAVAAASVARLAMQAAAVSSGASTSATLARFAKRAAASSAGASISVGGIVKTEHGPQAAKVSSGAVTAAQVARKASTPAAATAGALVRAEALRRAQTAAAASAGAVVAGRAQRVAQTAPRVSGGAVVTATVRRVAKVSAVVSSAAVTRASVSAHAPIRAAVSSGASVYANVVRAGQVIEPPTSTPVAGHVAIGQRGRIGVHRGRLPTGNIGRAER